MQSQLACKHQSQEVSSPRRAGATASSPYRMPTIRAMHIDLRYGSNSAFYSRNRGDSGGIVSHRRYIILMVERAGSPGAPGAGRARCAHKKTRSVALLHVRAGERKVKERCSTDLEVHNRSKETSGALPCSGRREEILEGRLNPLVLLRLYLIVSPKLHECHYTWDIAGEFNPSSP